MPEARWSGLQCNQGNLPFLVDFYVGFHTLVPALLVSAEIAAFGIQMLWPRNCSSSTVYCQLALGWTSEDALPIALLDSCQQMVFRGVCETAPPFGTAVTSLNLGSLSYPWARIP
jgi:hypothetical protein